MAVNYLTFGGIKSSDYGIYISGEGVFDAPKRAVEMVSVPGRNGAIALDQGYYENITVTYPAFNFEGSMSDFRTKLANFRNALASQVGYQRLTDTFHADEYRMAMFADGIEIKPVKYNTASQFDIKFNCKPQRFLTSGETAQTIAASGDTITNPTQYASSPLLAVKGYGEIEFNGYDIDIQYVTLGRIVLTGAKTGVQNITFDSSLVNASDAVTLSSLKNAAVYYDRGELLTSAWTQNLVVSKSNADCSSYSASGFVNYTSAYAVFDVSDIAFTAGTAGNVVISCDVVSMGQGIQSMETHSHKLKIAYDGTDTISIEYAIDSGAFSTYVVGNFGETIANSTVLALGNPTYIDCDLGECYMIKNGNIVSLNGVISLGSDLPTLKSGSNAITFDNTITELKVTPNWWKL